MWNIEIAECDTWFSHHFHINTVCWRNCTNFRMDLISKRVCELLKPRLRWRHVLSQCQRWPHVIRQVAWRRVSHKHTHHFEFCAEYWLHPFPPWFQIAMHTNMHNIYFIRQQKKWQRCSFVSALYCEFFFFCILLISVKSYSCCRCHFQLLSNMR